MDCRKLPIVAGLLVASSATAELTYEPDKLYAEPNQIVPAGFITWFEAGDYILFLTRQGDTWSELQEHFEARHPNWRYKSWQEWRDDNIGFADGVREGSDLLPVGLIRIHSQYLEEGQPREPDYPNPEDGPHGKTL